ncbi:MAG: hypothetical protein R3A52_26245 [Polyangiales bacterium]
MLHPLRTGLFCISLGLLSACDSGTTSGADASAADAPATDTAAVDAPVTDSGPSPVGTLADEAVSTCVWTTACLNTEDSFGGAAPNTNVGSCIATFIAQHTSSPGMREPWDDFRACVSAGPRDCEAFRRCLLARSAICELPRASGEMQDWIEGGLCADGTRSCTDLACIAPPCSTAQPTCTTDGTRVDECAGMVGRRVPCSRSGFPGGCVSFGGTDQCVAGAISTCTGGPSIRCDGTVAVRCAGGVEARLDCALFGQTCAASTGCVTGTACTYMDDACNGDTLRTCFGGVVRNVDCAALGGTCGRVRGAREACVLPEGSPVDAGVDAGIDASADVTTVDAPTADVTTADVAADTPPVDVPTDTTVTDAGSLVDAGPEAGAVDATADASAPCNAVTLQSSGVTPTRVAGLAPTPAGGTIANGTYHLSGWVLYDGALDDTIARRETLVILGARLESARDYSLAGGENPSRLNLDATTMGTTLALIGFCPAGGGRFTVGYTATATTLTLHQTNRLQVYTRQ